MWPGDALPQRGITNWSVFTGNKGAVANGWNSWIKPPGCNWVYIFAVGAGGGGGRPLNGSVTVGGGGGASGGVTRALFPARFLPDIIYARPGAGGLGATTSGSNGGNGLLSYLCIAPNTTAQNIIFTVGGGDGGGSNALGGAAGANTSSTSGIWVNSSIFTSLGGQDGADGAIAANTSGSNITFGIDGLCVTGGAGGGNGTGSGGSITGSGPLPTISGGATGGSPGNLGRPGFNDGLIISPGLKMFPMLFSGGSGGGGRSGNTAGDGGAGAYGSGGGGGGGTTGADGNSGNGGDGGDGFIMIGAF